MSLSFSWVWFDLILNEGANADRYTLRFQPNVVSGYDALQFGAFCRGILPPHVRRSGKITNRFEMVLVNDGSPDYVLDLALALPTVNSRIRVIDLSRNFGQHNAIWVP